MTEEGRPVEGMMPETTRKPHGCFFWGCLAALAVGVLIGGCVGLFTYQLYQMAMQATSSEPRPVPEYQARPGEATEVKERIEAFKKAAEEDRPAELALTGDDLNALIAQDPELRELKGHVFVRVEDGQVLLDVSVPLKKVPLVQDLPRLSGRYFNGSVGLKPALAGGRLLLFVESASVEGERLPDDFMRGLRDKNLLERARDEELVEFARQARSLEVQGDRVVLKR
jgi:hypothetical protein